MAERVYSRLREDVHPYMREWYTEDTALCSEKVLPYHHEGEQGNRVKRIGHCAAELLYQQSIGEYDRELAREFICSEDEWKMALRESRVPEPEPTCVTWWQAQQERLAEVDA